MRYQPEQDLEGYLSTCDPARVMEGGCPKCGERLLVCKTCGGAGLGAVCDTCYPAGWTGARTPKDEVPWHWFAKGGVVSVWGHDVATSDKPCTFVVTRQKARVT